MEARVTLQAIVTYLILPWYSPGWTSSRATQGPRQWFSAWGVQHNLRCCILRPCAPPSALPLHDLQLPAHLCSPTPTPPTCPANTRLVLKTHSNIIPFYNHSGNSPYVFFIVLCIHFIIALGSFFLMISFLSPSLHYELFEVWTIFSMSLPNESMNEMNEQRNL